MPPSMTLSSSSSSSLYIVYRSDNVFTAYRYIKPRSMLPPRLETFAQLSRPANSSPLPTLHNAPTTRAAAFYTRLRRGEERYRVRLRQLEPYPSISRIAKPSTPSPRSSSPRTNSFLLREREFHLTGAEEARRRDVSSVVSRLFPGGRNRVGAGGARQW